MLPLLFFAACSVVFAQSGLSGLFDSDDSNQILHPDEAFIVAFEQRDDNTAVATFDIQDEYFLYNHRFGVAIANSEDVTAEISSLTKGKHKYDEFFGDVEINRKKAVAEITFEHIGNNREAREIELDIGYQGCADIGICFPPQTKRVSFLLAAADSDSGAVLGNIDGAADNVTGNESSAESSALKPANAVAATTTGNTTNSRLGLSEQDRLANKLGQSSLPVIFALFVGLGLLLAFTPCVLPMVPILSGLIVGQGKEVTVAKATTLSVVYVLVMALTYALAGIAVGMTGAGIGFLQNPWVLTGFAALLVALSLSMFGFYELQMPQVLQQKVNSLSNSENGGSFASVALMGFLSALIVGPCVTAPLVGALIFIADTGDALVGGTALFALGLGMGLPLILVGASCGRLLPKAGAWMERVKAVFGVLLLAMAIWMLSRFLPAQATLALSAALAIVSGIYLGALDSLTKDSAGWQRLSKGSGLVAVIYGAALLIGALSNGSSLISPLKNFSAGSTQISGISTAGGNQGAGHELEFTAVKSAEELDAYILTSRQQGQPLILDFYADWCVSCKEMEAFTFTDPKVAEQMSRAMLLRADVTKNDKLDRGLLKRFSLFGPPAILFFSPQGQETRNGRVVGFMNKTEFYSHLMAVYEDMSIEVQASN